MDVLKTDDWVVGVMVALYEGGFVNKNDHPLFMTCYTQYTVKGSVDSDKVYFIRKALPKYEKALNTLNINPKKNGKVKDENVKKAFLYRQRIRLYFPYNDAEVAYVKKLGGALFSGTEKYWSITLNVLNAIEIRANGYVFDKALEEWYLYITEEREYESIIPQDLNRTLLPFQEEGLGFIEACGGTCLLADEMRLGKTVQALSYLHIHPEFRPALIVAPASLKEHWAKQIKWWGIKKASHVILQGTKITQLSKSVPIYIINYDILKNWKEVLAEFGFKVFIADESHRIMNPKSLRSKAIDVITEKIPHKILLTGTPMKNRPSDFFNLFKIIEPTLFSKIFVGKDAKNRYFFGGRFCQPTLKYFYHRPQWIFTGAENLDELYNFVNKKFMLRRLRKDVLPQLPDKQNIAVPLTLDNYNNYKEVLDTLLDGDLSKKVEFGAKEQLKQICAMGKIRQCIEWIEDFLESDEKLVVFAHHKFVVDELMNHFSTRAVKVDGSIDPTKRISIQEKFWKDDKVRLFIGNMQAAGEGLELAVASSVCFIEFPWSPTELDQCSDRVCSMMQKSNKIGIYFLVASDTVELDAIEMIDNKRNIIDAAVDGKDVTGNKSDLLDIILQKIREKQCKKLMEKE